MTWTPATTVTIEGVDFTGDTVGQVTIRRGRDTVYADPVAGYAVINLIDKDGTGFDIDPAVTVTVTVQDSAAAEIALFTGQVTDIDRSLYSPGLAGDPASITTLTAVGPLARLSRRQVLAAGRAPEEDADRIRAALEEGLSLTWEELPQDTWDDFDPTTTWATIDPGFDPDLIASGLFDLIALPAQEGGYSAFDVISQASASAQGVIYETGTGFVGWDNADSRGDDPTYTNIPGAIINAQNLQSSTSLSDIVNRVEVVYDGQVEEFRDDTSIVTFGRYDRRIETLLADQTAANRYGEDYLLRHAFPLINLSTVSVRLDGLDDADADDLLAIDINTPVFLEGLPDTLRVTNLPGFVEGLTWSIDAHRAQLTLSVSDAALSVGDIRWSQLPAALTWDDLPATLTWQDWRTTL